MVHIDLLERNLLNKSSDRELALFRFLEGKVHSFTANPNDPEDALCAKAYSAQKASVELEKLKAMKPFKGFHYSKNLITLIAASLESEDSESENIYDYIKSHSYRDLFIINKSLGKKFSIKDEPNHPIDCIAKKLLENKLITQDDIRNCISQINDLLDLFVVKQAISEIWTQLKYKNNIDTYQRINEINETIVSRLDISFKLIGTLAILFALLNLSPYVIKFAAQHWDQLEPLAYLLDKFILLVGLIGCYKFVISTKTRSNIIKYYLTQCYRLLGIDYDELALLKSTLLNKD